MTDITAYPDYSGLFDALADMVETADAPALAAVAALNASLAAVSRPLVRSGSPRFSTMCGRPFMRRPRRRRGSCNDPAF